MSTSTVLTVLSWGSGGAIAIATPEESDSLLDMQGITRTGFSIRMEDLEAFESLQWVVERIRSHGYAVIEGCQDCESNCDCCSSRNYIDEVSFRKS